MSTVDRISCIEKVDRMMANHTRQVGIDVGKGVDTLPATHIRGHHNGMIITILRVTGHLSL